MCIVVNKSTDHAKPHSICLFLFYFSAVYLCKRTMQNKSRLELDDYEAVSNLEVK